MPREGRSRYGLSPVGKWQGEINEPAMYTAKFKHKSVSYENLINPMTIYLTNRSQVAVRLFSNRLQMTSKCGKNKKVAHEAQPSVSLMFLPHFDPIDHK